LKTEKEFLFPDDDDNDSGIAEGLAVFLRRFIGHDDFHKRSCSVAGYESKKMEALIYNH
jgi:hypothetical protein